MKDFNFLIRFGVHKDRETIKNLNDSISGIVIPAHILCYSTDATIAAISYIQKDYYIDPMTYIFTGAGIRDYIVFDEKTKKDRFKPSIAKLTNNYGLNELFEKRNYSPLNPGDFTEDFVSDFCQKNLELQTGKIDKEKAGALKKYAELLKKAGEEYAANEMEKNHSPSALIPPYFFIDSLDSDWLSINIRLANQTKKSTPSLVIPFLFIRPSCLENKLLDAYKEYKQLFIWVDDFEQKQNINGAQKAELKKFAQFVREANSRGIKIINMRGTYFSVLLGKIGLGGICNGVFYGETKARSAQVGGVPPARYYIRKLHEFFGIPESIQVLKKYPELIDKECKKTFDLIEGNVDKIFTFEANHALAQAHFICSREAEIKDADKKDLDVLIAELAKTYDTYKNNFPDSDITTKKIDYLKAWQEALS